MKPAHDTRTSNSSTFKDVDRVTRTARARCAAAQGMPIPHAISAKGARHFKWKGNGVGSKNI